MATSKTLTPTNVTIQIPAMTDAPDQSVNSNCIDKLGDAVNTLNSQLTPTLLCETGYPLASAETSYDCNWSNYKLLIFGYCFYSNVLMTSVIPASDFNYTTTGRNIYLASDQSVTIQKNGNNAIKVAYSGANQNVQVKVWGVL